MPLSLGEPLDDVDHRPSGLGLGLGSRARARVRDMERVRVKYLVWVLKKTVI